MNILICDDLPQEASILDRLLHKAGFPVNTVVFLNGHDVMDYARSGFVIDVCILDIIMPDMNGIELSKRLRTDGFTGEIVFLSTSNEYGPESYEVKAFSYLLKPATPANVHRLLSDLNRTRNETDSANILLKTPGVARSVLLRDISHIEVIQHRVHYYLRNCDEIVVCTTFKEALAGLKGDPRFVQCHRSYMVNMDEIAEISEKEIVLRSGMMVPVARNHRDVRRRYYRYVFHGE